MKHVHLILATVLGSALAVGCVKETFPQQENTGNGMIPLNIEGSINQTQTKVSASGFSDNDALGLFAVNYTDNNATPGTLLLEGNQADNAKYIYDGEKFSWKSTKSVYYKDVYTHADLYLYYPYQNSIADINAFSFEIKADQNITANGAKMSGYEISDFLWGKAENITPTESKVPVVLNHKMSSASVKLIDGGGFDSGEWDDLVKSVVVINTTLKSTIDFATGIVTPVGEPEQKGIVMVDQEDGSFRAIVVPQQVPAATPLFAITVGTSTYKFKTNDVATYTSGKITSFDITVKKKTQTGDYEFELTNTEVTDWIEDKNTHGGEARQYFVVNVANKGELGKMIKAAGKNSNRIRNLKVTGQIDGHDFLFMRDSMKILEAVNLKECRTYGAISENYQNCFYERDFIQWTTLESLIEQYGQPDNISETDSEGYRWFYWYKEKDWDVIPVNAFNGKKSLCYFVFPEDTKLIASYAFSNTGLSGALIVPDNVTEICQYAFQNSNINSVSFGEKLKTIGYGAFQRCSSLSGELLLPESLTSIGGWCFGECSLTGRLSLPESLESIGEYAFYNSGSYNGNLEIPEKISSISNGAFSNCTFSGSLNLNNVTSIGSNAFYYCYFKGELTIPEGVTEVEEWAFSGNSFSSIQFPSTLKTIGRYAFSWNSRLCCDLVFPEGLITIGESAFEYNNNATAIELPSTVQTIQSRAFCNCYYVTHFYCSAVEPPIVQKNAFDGVPKDNFTLEVPAQSVKKYQSETGWADFKRINAHYDFSISRSLMRGLNAELSRTYTLRVPSGFDWSIDSKPDWVTVTPSSGTGKTDVVVTMNEMTVSSGGFNYQDTDDYGNYCTDWASGRSGEIVFKLEGKDYTTTMEVQQFNYEYGDGYVKTYQKATKGAGIDIVFIGDGYDAKDIAKGRFLSNAEEGYGHFFDVEPYKTYKDYFNVYAVISMSNESGIGTVNTIKDVKFGSYFTQNRILTPDYQACFDWARKADTDMNVNKSLVIMLMNTSTYEGVCVMGYDGWAIACCPVSTEAYPYDFRGIIQHEAGGHGFGKLGDEYIYHNAFIQTCGCACCDHPNDEYDYYSSFGQAKLHGWYKNLTLFANAAQVPWAHLIYNEKYSDYVDIFEGGYMHSRGVYRSEATSCMNNNIPYYSAISRQAIVERIMDYAGQQFSLEDFYANDDDSFGPTTKSSLGTFGPWGVDPNFVRATGTAPIFVDTKIK